ncbi:MAG TPA: chlorohydrolase family protein [Thermomicrobiaceae bacterium]|nr:chlorohydrolase family protein [Thermomicrobiaceae bacterium]
MSIGGAGGATEKRTRIDAGIVVAYQDGEHRILPGGVIVVEGNSIVHVGRSYDGPVDETIDARNMLVTPGMINTHTHLSESPLDKSFVEDVGKRQFSYSGLSEMLPARSAGIDFEGRRASVDYSMAELIRTGTTTVMEIGGIGDYVAEAAEKAGLRAYIANGYRSGRWLTRDGNKMEYSWDEEAGLAGFQRALEFIERVDGRANGRIKGFLSPSQVDTCTEELLRLSREASDRLRVPLALHVSQSVFEFDAIVQRHGLSPIEWLESIDFLSEWCILGHAILIAGNSWVQFAGDDLAILARTRASVAHNVWVFARRGIAMESFPRYLAAGVNMCLGTDTAPQSMIESLRWTAVIGKIMARQTDRATAADVFNAATLNAAKMLHRDDLGRISPGAKADLLFWRMDTLFMAPLRDPIKNLVYSATPEDLAHVMIDGSFVQRDGRVLTLDEAAVVKALQPAADRMWLQIPEGDWAHRSADEMSPPTYQRYQ